MQQPLMNRRDMLKLSGAGAGALALASAGAAASASRATTLSQATAASVEAALARLEALVNEEIRTTGVPGIAVGVVYKDQPVFLKGFGVREAGRPEPVDADTVFQLASLSKPVGSTAVAALVGEGVASWDTRISELDPSFAMYDSWVTREVTVRDFYCHRSGLPEWTGDLLEDLGSSRAEVLHQLRYQRPSSSLRTSYAYTNFGITAAATAVALAAGTTWEAASEQKVYAPLSMRSTSSRFSDFIARENRAHGHVQVDGRWLPRYQRQPDAQAPAGGVSSTVTDLSRWMRLQIANGRFEGRQIVAEAPLTETHHPHILTGYSPLTGLPGFYGLGWNVGYDAGGRLHLGHSGAFALGAGTNVALVPKEELGIIVLTNAQPIGVAEGLSATFVDLALYGTTAQDWLALYKRVFSNPAAIGVKLGFDYSTPPATRTASLANDAYVGMYGDNLFFGDIEVIAAGAGLAIVEGPERRTFPLTHYDRDIFTYVTEGENAVGTTGATFAIGPDGKASSVVVENLDIHGQGTFKRATAGG